MYVIIAKRFKIALLACLKPVENGTLNNSVAISRINFLRRYIFASALKINETTN